VNAIAIWFEIVALLLFILGSLAVVKGAER
jgi:hypothetical protein